MRHGKGLVSLEKICQGNETFAVRRRWIEVSHVGPLTTLALQAVISDYVRAGSVKNTERKTYRREG